MGLQIDFVGGQSSVYIKISLGVDEVYTRRGSKNALAAATVTLSSLCELCLQPTTLINSSMAFTGNQDRDISHAPHSASDPVTLLSSF